MDHESRCRSVAQTLIECVGSDGPMSLEEAAAKAVEKIRTLESGLTTMGKEARLLAEFYDYYMAENGLDIRKFKCFRGSIALGILERVKKGWP